MVSRSVYLQSIIDPSSELYVRSILINFKASVTEYKAAQRWLPVMRHPIRSAV